MIGDIFPLEIKDFPLEMLNYDYFKHQEELQQFRNILSQIRRYNRNKENFTIKQTIQWIVYIFKCAVDII